MPAHDPDPGADEDSRRVRRVLAGETEVFAELVAAHKQRILGYVFRFSKDRHEMDDLCQDIFIGAYRKLSQFRGDAPFGHWLMRLAVNRCHDHLRQKRRADTVPLEAGDLADLPATDDARQWSAEESRTMLEWAFARLTPEERTVLTLAEIEQKSVAEISGLTGWSESNVKVRSFRARKKLAAQLEKIREKL